jgi:hypothetical protein
MRVRKRLSCSKLLIFWIFFDSIRKVYEKCLVDGMGIILVDDGHFVGERRRRRNQNKKTQRGNYPCLLFVWFFFVVRVLFVVFLFVGSFLWEIWTGKLSIPGLVIQGEKKKLKLGRLEI